MDTPTPAPAPAAPAPAPPRRRARWLLAIVALLLAAVGVAVWLGGREAALQLLARRIELAGGGNLTVQGARGSLYGAMHVDRIVLRSPERVITASDIDLAWSPSNLARRTVAVERLTIGAIDVEQRAKSTEPVKLPATLALPLGMRLDVGRAQVRRLTIRAGGKRTGIDAIAFGLHGDRRQWALRDASAATPWGRLTAQATVGAQKPYAVQGSARLAAREAVLDAGAAGTLQALQLALAGRGRGATADMRLALAPFDPLILRSIRLDAEGVNPLLWDAGWPKADFAMHLDAGIAAGGAVHGDVALDNRAAPGPIDRQQAPLRRLTARLRGNLELLRLDGVLIDLGAAGRFTGAGTLAGTPGKGPAARFALRTDGLDLRGILASMHPTRIAGDIVLANEGQTGLLDARLAQDGFLLDVKAQLAGAVLTLKQATLRARSSAVALNGTLGLDGARPFRAAGSIGHFNPADFGKFPAADVNAGFTASGSAASAWRAQAEFALRPSRFAGQPLSGRGRLRADARHVDAIDVQLALGGNALAAQGAFGAPGDRLQWQLDGRQLAALRAGLAGAVHASGAATGTYAAPATTFALEARGLRWEKEQRATAAGDSLLTADGTLALRERVPEVRARGRMRGVDPSALSALGALPRGRIDGDFGVAGRLGENWSGTLDLVLLPSELLGAPLSGRANVAADVRHVSRADVDLRLGANRFTAQGRFGARGDTLAWRLDAPQLAVLGRDFGGAVQAAGTLAGTVGAPSVRLDGSASALKFRTHTLAQAAIHVAASSVPGTPLEARLALRGYRAGQPVFDTLTFDLAGTSHAHTLKVAAKSPAFDADAEVAGQWRDGEWQGMLRALQNRGRDRLALQAPAPLRFAVLRGAGGVRLERLSFSNATIALRRGAVTLRTLEKNGPHWKSSGEATGLPLRYLASFHPLLDDIVAGDMTVGATWNVDLGAELNGGARIVRESGDLALGADLPVLLGLTAFDAQVTLAANALQARFDMQGTRSGVVHVDADTRLVRQDGRWRIGNASPLRLTGSVAIDSIAFLAPVVGPVGLELGGKLAMSLIGSGTVGAPQLLGQMNGDALTVTWADQGVRLRNGELRARLEGEQLMLQTLRFDGEEGTLRAEGGMRFAEAAPTMNVRLLADGLRVLSRPDRVLVMSGAATATLAQKRLEVEGKFRADRAEIEIARRNGLTVSDDVVVVHGAGGKPAQPAKRPSAVTLALDVEAGLGERFHLSGMGLDAKLAGSLRIRTQGGDLPRATGAIRVENGTYRAYGQDLVIERGVLNFNGPLDNPAINILAMRRHEDKTSLFAGANDSTYVEAGVEVRGTARSPSAKLISTPNVPDSEKLSWLVLGHGMAGTSAKEFDVLGAAASALLGSNKATSLQGRLAGSLGLDTFGLSNSGSASGLEGTVLTVGKRISRNAYLTFERGASSASNLVKLNYALSRRLSLQLQAGANTAIDVLYSWAFD